MFAPELEPDEMDAELFQHFELQVDLGQAPLRLDKFLFQRLSQTSRTKIQYACEEGLVKVNKHAKKSNYRIKPGDDIRIFLPHPPRILDLKPEAIPIDIRYEDAYLLMVNKPPGMVVHPAFGHYSGTLVNALLFHFQNLPVRSQLVSGDLKLERPGLVHRIDKNTSGILLIAKTEHAMMRLARLFYEHDLDRRYIALCWGVIPQNSGTLKYRVGRDPKNRKRMYGFAEDSDLGKTAITHFRVLKRYSYLTLLECRLETGRTHQIRVHFKTMGHPLFGDSEYGGDIVLRGLNTASYRQFVHHQLELLPRQALHAQSLSIKHPFTQQLLTIEAELPEDFKTCLERWDAFEREQLKKS